MRRHLALIAFVSAVAVVSFGVPSAAQTIPPTTAAPAPQLAVTGVAACTTASSYKITWTLANTSQTTVEFMGGVMAGAASGAVQFSPSVINPGQTMTGLATVPGTTKGTVTITVSTLIGNIGPADYTGTVQLDGTCVTATPAPATQAPATFTG
jgi:hypothetical protein